MSMLRLGKQGRKRFYLPMSVDALSDAYGSREKLIEALEKKHGDELDSALDDNSQALLPEQPWIEIKLQLTVGEMRLGSSLMDDIEADSFVIAICRAVVAVGGDWLLYHALPVEFEGNGDRNVARVLMSSLKLKNSGNVWDALDLEAKVKIIGALENKDATHIAAIIGKSTTVTQAELRNLT